MNDRITGPGRRVGQMRPHTALESPAELRDAMRAEIRQLRAENQRLKSELAGKEKVACPHCVDRLERWWAE